jgi:hypothetical protein
MCAVVQTSLSWSTNNTAELGRGRGRGDDLGEMIYLIPVDAVDDLFTTGGVGIGHGLAAKYYCSREFDSLAR